MLSAWVKTLTLQTVNKVRRRSIRWQSEWYTPYDSTGASEENLIPIKIPIGWLIN